MSKKKLKPDGPGPDKTAWMVTFSDLLMLMLTFFVLLLTMSSMDSQQVKEKLRPGLNTTNDNNSGQSMNIVEPFILPTEIDLGLRRAIQDLMGGQYSPDLDRYLEELFITFQIDGDTWFERRPEELLINLDGHAAFVRGEARLTPEASGILREFARLLEGMGLNVIVETYFSRGNSVIDRDQAWDLALARADVAANYMVNQGFAQERLRVMGYGFQAGRNEGEFLRQSDLLRLRVVTRQIPPRTQAEMQE
ncbi:MAG: OmpA family protein [Myxococcales bacterium]|nr:OmpA family protein [Myxococcales bacterium]